MRCSSLQTRKHRRRHVPSSSRCQGISTRCTGVPHSWHGGEAAAISSALVIAFCCAAWSRAGTHPGARVPCDRRSRLLRNSGVPGPRASSLIEIRRRFAGSFGPARRLLNGPFVQRSHASVMQAVDAASRCCRSGRSPVGRLLPALLPSPSAEPPVAVKRSPSGPAAGRREAGRLTGAGRRSYPATWRSCSS
jgi:hypothetical protein